MAENRHLWAQERRTRLSEGEVLKLLPWSQTQITKEQNFQNTEVAEKADGWTSFKKAPNTPRKSRNKLQNTDKFIQ